MRRSWTSKLSWLVNTISSSRIRLSSRSISRTVGRGNEKVSELGTITLCFALLCFPLLSFAFFCFLLLSFNKRIPYGFSTLYTIYCYRRQSLIAYSTLQSNPSIPPVSGAASIEAPSGGYWLAGAEVNTSEGSFLMYLRYDDGD